MARPDGMLTMGCCGPCCEIGNCIGFNWSASPASTKDVQVVITNKPSCATDISNSTPYILPLISFSRDSISNFNVCVWLFGITFGFSGDQLQFRITTRDVLTGTPGIDARVSYCTNIGLGALANCFTIASGNIVSLTGVGVSCPPSTNAGGAVFDAGQLCNGDTVTVGDDLQVGTGASSTRAAVTLV